MRRTTLGACALALAVFMTASHAEAQEQNSRYVVVTTFDVPYGPDRGKVLSYLNEYFLPTTQLNPKVRNSRVLMHNWGKDAMQVVMFEEYDTWADIMAPCGQPCDDYNAQHAAPEEGEAGYTEYQEKSDLFFKAFSSHSDEIYTTNMNRAVNEGKRPTLIGAPAPAAGGN
jgi:hypothetical protein